MKKNIKTFGLFALSGALGTAYASEGKASVSSAKISKISTKAPEKKGVIENAKTKVLKNGLRIIVIEDHDVPRLSIGVLINVGSADDKAHLRGLSHMAEHMYFKGTKRFPTPDKTMSKYGGTTNAFTSADYTFFITDCPANSLPIALNIEADRLANAPKISMREFSKERAAVFEERLMRIDNDPLGQADEWISAAQDPSHPYGNSVIGSKQNIKAYTEQDVMNHYRSWYVPNNTTLIIVGDADAEKTFEMASRLFGSIPAHDTPPRDRGGQYKTRWDVRQKVVYETDKIETIRIDLQYHVPHHRLHSAPGTSLDGLEFSAALSVALNALFGGIVFEFSHDLVDKQKIAANIASHYHFGFDPRPVTISATLRPKVSEKKFMKAYKKRLQQVIKQGLSQEDFERSKRYFLNLFRYDIPDSHEDLRYFWKALAQGFTFEDLRNCVKFYESVTKEQVDAAIRIILSRDPNVSIFKPRNCKKGRDEETGGAVEKGAFPQRLIDAQTAKIFSVKLPPQDKGSAPSLGS